MKPVTKAALFNLAVGAGIGGGVAVSHQLTNNILVGAAVATAAAGTVAIGGALIARRKNIPVRLSTAFLAALLGMTATHAVADTVNPRPERPGLQTGTPG